MTPEINDAVVESYCQWFQEILEWLEKNTGLSEEEIVEVAPEILDSVGRAKNTRFIQNNRSDSNQKSSGKRKSPRKGVREFLENNKEGNEFYQSLWDSLQKYNRLTKGQYEAIEDDVEDYVGGQ